ncbi:hypothetical protein [Nocardia wallacei]|uniref:hypothetical protein n=1 Tax=Nocardia wallacei TaxID=480035 RepID=UPI002455A053|nr:hypothetical protein [Nocardia wallacei]
MTEVTISYISFTERTLRVERRIGRGRGMTLAGQVFVVQLVVLVAVVAVGVALTVWELRRDQDDATARRVTGIGGAGGRGPAGPRAGGARGPPPRERPRCGPRSSCS